MVHNASNRDRRHSAPVNPTPRKRRHPSKKSRAGALALSVAATGGLSYVVATSASAAATTAAPLTSASIDTTTAAATSAGATGATLSTTPAASTKLATPTASTTINGAVFGSGDVSFPSGSTDYAGFFYSIGGRTSITGGVLVVGQSASTTDFAVV